MAKGYGYISITPPNLYTTFGWIEFSKPKYIFLLFLFIQSDHTLDKYRHTTLQFVGSALLSYSKLEV